jgi:hypothetical protein
MPLKRTPRPFVCYIILTLFCTALPTHAALFPGLISEAPAAASFPLAAADHAPATLWTDPADHAVVRIAAGYFADDVARVTGRRPVLATDSATLSGEVILAGTLGHSALIDRLVAEKRLDASTLRDRWESFQITLVANPLPGVSRALVVAGADRRGTAYGLLALSEAIGVSPWYWWADVAPAQRPALHLSLSAPFTDGPAVRYRGIFLNDERFGGLANWAAAKIDPDRKNIGPETYKHVFELLLRLRANYLWPAMHPGTAAFNAFPENARNADDHAIVMGSSHCEIMLRNNEDEWKRPGTWGDYNYRNNRDTMIRYWEERVTVNGRYENIYTIGLRGLHDYAMKGAKNEAERVELTRLALADQRALLAKHVNPDLARVPQLLCAYKEVLDTYRAGIDLPPDVTLLWADDNHGFLRNLSDPAEQQRPGGSGIYYHLSYYGDPESYLWLSSLSPALLAAELGKALAYHADRVWVFNVGDIKPAEKELTFAMEMAWDPRRWTPANAHTFPADFATRTFGPAHAPEIAAILDGYYRLAAAGKPEQTWLLDYYGPAQLDARLAAYRDLAARATALAEQIPAPLRDAYFQLVLYPVAGAARLNELHLLSRRSLWRAQAGETTTALADADAARAAIPELDRLTRTYTTEIAGGKWKSIITWENGQRAAWPSYKRTPRATPEILAAQAAAPAPVTLDLATQPATSAPARLTWKSTRPGRAAVWFQTTTPIYYGNEKPERNTFWTLGINDTPPAPVAIYPWGNIWHLHAVGPQWTRVAEIDVAAGENTLVIAPVSPAPQLAPGSPAPLLYRIHIGLTPPPPADPLLVVPADAFAASHDAPAARIVRWPGLGPTGRAVSLEPFTAPSLPPERAAEAPSLDYALTVPAGATTLEIRTLPTQRIHLGRQVRYMVALDDEAPRVLDIHTDEFTSEWQQNVLRGTSLRTLSLPAGAAGKTLRVRLTLLDPGVILDSLAFR